MNLKSFFPLIFIFCLILLSSSPSSALNVGDTFEYIVKGVEGSFNYYCDTTLINGTTDLFKVGDTTVSEESELHIEVTDLTSSKTTYSISDINGEKLTTASSTSLSFALNLLYYSSYPFIVLGLSTNSVIPIEIDKGVSLSDGFYVAPPQTNWNSIFDQYNESDLWDDYIGSLTSKNDGSLTVTHSAKWYDNNETLSFILTVVGDYEVTSEDTNLFIIHSIRFDYSVLNNSLLGYKLNSNTKGTLDGEDTTFVMRTTLTQKEYERIQKSPGFELCFILITLGIVTKFRKKSKKTLD